MNILILGGTGFVGRHLTAQALERGHEVTLFNRGRTAPALFPTLTTLVGDRQAGFASLPRVEWDAVIDTHAQTPAESCAAAREIRSRLHVFISTVSVYDFEAAERIDEDAPLAHQEGLADDDRSPETYGARKAAAERAILELHEALIIRPGLIVGPHDPTDRFTYWPLRVAEGGDVIAPPSPSEKAAFIDVRDLARWMVLLVERGQRGIFNAFDKEPTFGDLLEKCRAIANPSARIRWTPLEILEAHKVAPWSDLPVWAPGLPPLHNERAQAAGLVFRPLEETIADTLSWAKVVGKQRPLRAGLSAEREAQLLAVLEPHRGA